MPDILSRLSELHAAGRWSHMPYLASDGTLLLCLSWPERALWKMHYLLPNGRLGRIETGKGGNECSPMAWHDGQQWHVSFISTGMNVMLTVYSLWHMEGPHLWQMGEPTLVREGPRSGFVDARGAVYEDHGGVVTPSGRLTVHCQRLYRVMPCGESLRMSLLDERGALVELEYNERTGEETELLYMGQALYKSTSRDGVTLFAERVDGFEERRIRPALYVTAVRSRRVTRGN